MATTKKLSAEERKRMEDVKANQLLLIFGLAGGGLLLLSAFKRLGLFAVMGHSTADTLVGVALMALGVVGTVCGLLWAKSALAKGNNPAFRVFNGFGLAGASFSLLLCALLLYFFYDSGLRFAYILIIIMAAFAIFRLLFQPEFFVSALFLGIGAFLFYMLSRIKVSLLVGYLYPLAWVTAGLGLAFVVSLLLLRRWKGKLFGFSLLPKVFSYLPPFLAAVAVLAAALFCLFVSMSYLIFAALGLGAILLAYGVYYTLRLL